jgi:putative transposase
MQDLKTVYQAATKDKAELEFEKLNDKWGVRYPVVIKFWQNNWHKLSAYFAYD